MKILFICQRLHPNYTDSLCALSTKHDVSVLVRATGYPNERLADLHVETYPESVLSRAIGRLLSMLGKHISQYNTSFPSLRFLLRQFAAGQCDVVYVRRPVWLYLAVRLMAALRGRTLLVYEQDICPAMLARRDNRIFPLVSAPAPDTPGDYPPPNFVPLTINLEREFGHSACAPYSPSGTAPLRLMHVGKLIERKGQTIIFEAVRALIAKGVNVRLSMYSHTPTNAFRERLLQAASDFGISEHVQFMPQKSADEMLAEYRQHHLFVYSGWVRPERSPDELTYARATGACGTRLYSLIEAMAAGLPVVCASEKHVAGAVENGGNGLIFEKGDAADLAAKIEAISGMDLAAMGARSRTLIETHHDAKDFPARFEAVLASRCS